MRPATETASINHSKGYPLLLQNTWSMTLATSPPNLTQKIPRQLDGSPMLMGYDVISN